MKNHMPGTIRIETFIVNGHEVGLKNPFRIYLRRNQKDQWECHSIQPLSFYGCGNNPDEALLGFRVVLGHAIVSMGTMLANPHDDMALPYHLSQRTEELIRLAMES